MLPRTDANSDSTSSDFCDIARLKLASTLHSPEFAMSGQTANRVKDTARSVATKVETAATETVNNPVQAKQDFLHLPLTRAALPFVNGGIAGMTATAVIQPIDMIKVRLQLAGEGVKTGPKPTPLGITRDIIAQGRFLDLYNGLSAGLLRQAVYTTARLGFFDTFSNMFSARAKEQGRGISFAERAAAGLSAGGLAAMVGILQIWRSFACNQMGSSPKMPVPTTSRSSTR